MFKYIISSLIWAGWRLIVSGLCLFTIQNLISQEGYKAETKPLILIAICLVIGVRVWMPFGKDKTMKSDMKDSENNYD